MKKNSHCLVALALISALFAAGGSAAHAQEDPAGPPDDFRAEVFTGYHHYNVKGYRGKVGEYDALDSGAELRYLMEGADKNYYLYSTGEILDKNDQSYHLIFDMKRLVHSEIMYKRFRHFLDHDPLENQEYVSDYDKNRSNGITVEEIKAENTFRIPLLPGVTFNADYRSYSKRGHRQATTVAKCSQCHVGSRNRRVNTTTSDVTGGVEIEAGPATLTYEHLWRTFRESGDEPYMHYGYGASFFNVQGTAPYSRVPDSKLQLNRFALKYRLPLDASLYATYQFGEKTNRDTHHDIDFRNIALRLSKRFARYVACDLYYSRYTMDNSAPDAIDRDHKRGGMDISLRPLKKTTVKLSYQWDDIERSHYMVGSTFKETYRVTLNHRLSRSLRIHGKYQKRKIDDPFALQDRIYPKVSQTMLPSAEDEFYISLSWNPRNDLSLNGNLRYLETQSGRYHLDEERLEYSLSLWYAPYERLSLTATYSFIENTADTRAAYKTYHMRDAASLFLFDDVPYDDRSHSLYLAATYRVSPRLSLSGDITLMRSNADFDAVLDSRNVGELSDIEIDRHETSLGATYLLTNSVSVYATYIYREYDDRTSSYLDGQFSYILCGVSWRY